MGLFGSKKDKADERPKMLGVDLQEAQAEALRELQRRIDKGYDANVQLVQANKGQFDDEYAYALPSGDTVYVQTSMLEFVGEGVFIDVSAGRMGEREYAAFYRAEIFGEVGRKEYHPLTNTGP